MYLLKDLRTFPKAEVPPLLVMQGVAPEDPLRMGDLNQLGDNCFHPVVPGESTRGGECAMDVLNGGKFCQDLAVEKLCPPIKSWLAAADRRSLEQNPPLSTKDPNVLMPQKGTSLSSMPVWVGAIMLVHPCR